MDPSGQSSRALPRTLWALLLLLMLGAALAVYIGSRDLRTEARHNSPSERPETATAVPRVKAGQGPPPPADPLPPAGPPASGAEVRPAPEIPPLTPFRRLVLEADTVLELLDLDEPGYTGQSAAVLHAILSGIRSEFSKYSEQRLSGRLPPQEHQNLRVAAHDAFRNPDVDTRAYRIDRAPRVQLWLREGATLPAAEVRTPPGEIPLRRRAQEEVTVETVARWLEAIEAEFGTTDFGAGTRRLPLDIVVFDSQPAYLQFAQDRLSLKPPKWSAGFFSAGWDVICAPTLESTSFAEVLRHEMFHAVQAHLAHGSLGVPWFAEGTAEWLDKAPPKAGVPATHSGFAAAARGHLRYLLEQGLAFELAKFLALDLPAFYGEPELNYLIAYCFVDFLRAKEDLRKVYFEFWALMKDGMAPPDAFYRSFGVLDMADVQRRFLAWLREAPVQQTPVRFTHDAPVDFKDLPLPPALGGTPAAGKSGEIGAGWFQAIGKLKDAGLASAGAPGFIKGDYDLLIVACDNSESMGRPLDESTFDFEAFRRWLFSVRFAGTIKLTRAGAGGESDEEVPPVILISLVESVITDRLDDFVASTGIKVGKELQKQINAGWEQFYLTTELLKSEPRRALCQYAAESVAWYWGVRQDRAGVVFIDFNTGRAIEKENNQFRGDGIKSSSSPLARLFAKTASRRSPVGSDGADTDWWLGLSGITENGGDVLGKRAAVMFFTDGACSAGEFGQVETARDDVRYQLDMARLAERFGEHWRGAALDAAGRESVLQLFCLPGAQGQGLDELLKTVPQARLDDWTTRFKK